MDPRRLTAVALLLIAMTPCAHAQETPEQIAQRLKELVDRRIADLRSELHQEIDAALGRGIGVSFGPVSIEFRELHRLPAGVGAKVVALSREIPSDRAEFLSVGDVILSVSQRPVGGTDDFQRAVRSMDVWSGWGLSVVVIRKGERQTVSFNPGRFSRPMTPPTETADQMLDRLWDKALKDVVGAGGIQEVTSKSPTPESRPSQKFPIPPEGGRR